MSAVDDSRASHGDGLTLDHAIEIDRLCTVFETLRRAREPLKVESCLLEVPPEARPTALFELLAVEFELRRERGMAIDLKRWQRRFPGSEEIVLLAARASTAQDLDRWLDSRRARSS